MGKEPIFEADECFISDLGQDRVSVEDGAPMLVGRYAVWRAEAGTGRYQMLEIGWDLGVLLEKYQIGMENVGKVGS